MVRKSVGRLAKSFATCFVGIRMCISRASSKWCSKDISELDCFRDKRCRNLTGRSERTSGSDVNLGGGDRVVSLDLFSAVEVDIYSCSFISQSNVLL